MHGKIFGKCTAKDYLKQIAKQKELIRCLEATEFSLRTNSSRISCGFNADKIQSSPKNDAIPDTVATIVDLENGIKTRTYELSRLQRDAIQYIANIPDSSLQTVLIARYIEVKKWEDISISLNYSLSHLYKLHNKAIAEFARCNPMVLEEFRKDDSF